MNTRIKAIAEQEQGLIVRFLRDLIALPSYSGQEGDAAAFIARFMEESGYEQVVTDPIGNVHGRIGTGSKRILYDGHMDTVKVGERGQWSCDPFTGTHEVGRIYGRGASDMKTGLVSLIFAGRWIKKLGLEGDYTLVVSAVVEEEEAEGTAIGEAHRKGFIPGFEDGRIDACMLAEPSKLHLKRGQRGRVELALSSAGRSCHGSMPDEGENALYKLAPFITRIEKMQEAKELGFHSDLGYGSIAVTQCEAASGSMNTIPDSAWAYVDRRLTLGETPESALSELRALAGSSVSVEMVDVVKRTYCGYELKCLKAFLPWILSPDAPLLEASRKSYRDLFDSAPEEGFWVFSTDGVYTAGKAGIPTLGFGPGREECAHKPDEWVEEGELLRAAMFYAALPSNFSSLP